MFQVISCLCFISLGSFMTHYNSPCTSSSLRDCENNSCAQRGHGCVECTVCVNENQNTAPDTMVDGVKPSINFVTYQLFFVYPTSICISLYRERAYRYLLLVNTGSCILTDVILMHGQYISTQTSASSKYCFYSYMTSYETCK